MASPSLPFSTDSLRWLAICYNIVKINKLLEHACRYLKIPLQGATWDTVADEIMEIQPDLYDKCWKEAFGVSTIKGDDDDDENKDEKDEDVHASLCSPPKRIRTSQDHVSGDTGMPTQSMPSSSCSMELLESQKKASQPTQETQENQNGNEVTNNEMGPVVPTPGTRIYSLKFDQQIAVIKSFYLGLIRFHRDFWLLPFAEAEFKEPKPETPEEKEYNRKVFHISRGIQNAKTRGASPGQYQGEFQAIYYFYELTLKQLNSVDFNDMLFMVHSYLRRSPETVDAIKDRYRYIMCDECQDLNPLQLALTLMLSTDGRLTCVGDDAQSIYRFRGSETWTMHAIENLHLHLNPQVRRVLNLNYRSTQNILDVAQVVLKDQAKELIASTGINKSDAPVTILETGTVDDEAEYIRRQIQRLHAQGVPYKQMAFLYRKKRDFLNSTYGPLQSELNVYSIPHKLLSEKSLLNRVVIKDIRAYLTLALNPHNDDAFLVAVNRPRRGFGEAAEGILKKFQEENPDIKSLFDCVEPLCAKRLLSEAQARGLRSFAKMILTLHHSVWTRDPAEFVYFVLKRTKYVLWAEAMSRRRRAVKDDPDASFDFSGAFPEGIDLYEQHGGTDEFIREIMHGPHSNDDEDSDPSDDSDEESYDDSGSSSDDNNSSEEEDEVNGEFIPKRKHGLNNCADEAISKEEGVGPSTRRRARKETIKTPSPPPEMEVSIEAEDATSTDDEADERNYTRNINLFREDKDPSSDFDTDDEVDDDDDEGDTDESEDEYDDPLKRYRFDLSRLGATTGPLRRLLREAALFTEDFRFKGPESEMSFRENHMGPPSLQRIALEAGASDPRVCQEFYKNGKAQGHAELLRLGPAVMMEFMDHVFESREEEASALDTDNVILSTIHGAKGLEWDVVFLPRFNKDTIPVYLYGDDPVGQAVPPDEPFIQNYEPPASLGFGEEHEREERRLAHVGITRARKKLYITMIRYVQAKWKSHKVENPSVIVRDIVDHFVTNPPFEESDPCGIRRRQVIEVIRMPETWREQEVGKLWYTEGVEAHPHPLWNFLEEERAQEESQ